MLPASEQKVSSLEGVRCSGKPDYLYTIGSPRVGDNDFVNILAGVDVRRFVDCCDIVTRVPPENLSLTDPYKHFGDPSYIDRDGNLQENQTDAFMLNDRLHASADYILKTAGSVEM